jgi:LysR family transcriptional activator of glutamate synthase operon
MLTYTKVRKGIGGCMNIAYIESFLETAKQKSISKASERLQITHPALSKQIRSLEAYYGVTLFKRSSSGVELTEAGIALHERIQPLYEELMTLRTDLANLHGIRKIVLGTLPSLAAHYMPEKVYAMEKRKVKVEIVVSNTSQELYKQLKAGAIDAALCEHLPAHASIWGADLFSEPYVVVVYKNHRLAGYKTVSLAELDGEPLILHPPDCSIRRLFTNMMERQGIHPNIKTEVSFGEFILGYVEAGGGITFVPQTVADRISHTNLYTIPIEASDARRTISLISSADDVGKYLLPFFK